MKDSTALAVLGGAAIVAVGGAVVLATRRKKAPAPLVDLAEASSRQSQASNALANAQRAQQCGGDVCRYYQISVFARLSNSFDLYDDQLAVLLQKLGYDVGLGLSHIPFPKDLGISMPSSELCASCHSCKWWRSVYMIANSAEGDLQTVIDWVNTNGPVPLC